MFETMQAVIYMYLNCPKKGKVITGHISVLISAYLKKTRSHKAVLKN